MPLTQNDFHANDPDGWAATESAPLFTGVSPEDFRTISAAARLKRFAGGERLYGEGDTDEQVLLLISGFVRITQMEPNATEVILRLSAPGYVLDAVGLFSTGRHYTRAQAIRGCEAAEGRPRSCDGCGMLFLRLLRGVRGNFNWEQWLDYSSGVSAIRAFQGLAEGL